MSLCVLAASPANSASPSTTPIWKRFSIHVVHQSSYEAAYFRSVAILAVAETIITNMVTLGATIFNTTSCATIFVHGSYSVGSRRSKTSHGDFTTLHFITFSLRRSNTFS